MASGEPKLKTLFVLVLYGRVAIGAPCGSRFALSLNAVTVMHSTDAVG